jgi:DNA-directed RNA polymerase specialized sigma24 family protein
MFCTLPCSWFVQPMTQTSPPRTDAGVWDDAIRKFDRQVYLSVLALGLGPERAREISQAAWTKLIERHATGALAELELPGLAIRQARFLGLNELQRSKVEKRVLAAVPDEAPPASIDVERQVDSRAQVEKVLAALATCSPTARRVFRLVYATPGGSPAHAAQEVGLSLQRVRQILCETRAHIRKSIATDEVAR